MSNEKILNEADQVINDLINHLPSPPLSTDNNGCIKPQKKTQPCKSCQGFGWYSDFGYDEPQQKQCGACHGLGYEERNDD